MVLTFRFLAGVEISGASKLFWVFSMSSLLPSLRLGVRLPKRSWTTLDQVLLRPAALILPFPSSSPAALSQ